MVADHMLDGIKYLIRIPILVLPGILLLFSLSFPNADAALKTRREMPEFLDIPEWINTAPLSRKNLAGKVVLVHFWNYASLESQQTAPRLETLYRKYEKEAFSLIGIHSAEFAFEKNAAGVRKAAEKLKIHYPIAIDVHDSLWRAYGSRHRPSYYLIDHRGRIRYLRQGTIDLKQWEALLLDLLHEKGSELNLGLEEFPALTTSSSVTPKIYFGYKRLKNFGGEERLKAGVAQFFKFPASFARDQFYLSGQWRPEEECLSLAKAPGSLAIFSRANHIWLVLGLKQTANLQAEILLEGKPIPKTSAGKDLTFQGEKSTLTLDTHRLYEVMNDQGGNAERLIEMRFATAAVEVYAAFFE